ncbi:hypothetical protein EVAR_82591_1 [Eumeta japonica]|uniref:Uncharacterized protein n=1 Tax=Eumeta variegata TaxID=151549 RepID=A0A4C1X6H2_EUMVA|nr:hypothetical protein EVAR_82591_1 [Eumeta japonica]
MPSFGGNTSSPDLNPLYFFYWGAVKEKVYLKSIESEFELRQRIAEAAKFVNNGRFARKIARSLLKRCRCSFEPRSVVSGSTRVRVCGVPRSVNRAAAVKRRASVPATSSGYPDVCTPSPHTVSAPRERSRSFHTPIQIAILVISRVFTRVNGLPLTT